MTLGRLPAAVLVTLAMAGVGAAGAQPAARDVVFTAADLMQHVRTLAAPEMEGRRAGTAGNAKARQWIVQQFREAGLEPIGKSYEWPFTFERREPGRPEPSTIAGVNLVGLCRGKGAKDRGVLVISAHYDHLGVRDGATFHGADDNASGVAVLLALARQCRRTPWMHDALFASFDAEEMGLQGARAFIAAPPIEKQRLAFNINLDMVARGDKGELYAAGTSHRPALRAVLQPEVARAGVKLLFGHDSGGGPDDWTTQSDHGVFHSAGIPFLYFGVEDHPDYHRPTDTPDKIDPSFFFRAAVTILDAVTAIDRALPLPAK